jgi:glutamyl-tRNA reductase
MAPKLAMAGVNYKTAPVSVRERLALSNGMLESALSAFPSSPDAPEVLIVSTCNRTEVYAAPRSDCSAVPEPVQLLARPRDLRAEDLQPYLYQADDEAAVRHLFAVAAGVDSMILGEHEVLGQVRNAAEAARKAGTLGKVLDRLCNQAIATGRRVRTETGIGQGALSVASVAVELAESIFADLTRAKVLILGAGENSELVAARLVDCGVNSVLVGNRTFERAAQLAERFGGRAVHFDALDDELCHADIVIASTGAPHHVISCGQVQLAMRRRRQRPIFCIDLAVPRDIDPLVGSLENVFLYDIDDLEQVVAANTRERESELPQARRIIEEEAASFARWMHSLDTLSTVLALREKAERARDEEVRRALGRMRSLTRGEEKAIHDLSKALVSRLIGEAIEQLQSRACDEGTHGRVQALRELFALDEFDCDATRGQREEADDDSVA